MADNELKLIGTIAQITNGPGKYELMLAIMEGSLVSFVSGETWVFECRVKKLERQGGNEWVIGGTVLRRWISSNSESIEKALGKEECYENTPREFECDFNTHYRKGSLKEY